jgi:hypothetical protein
MLEPDDTQIQKEEQEVSSNENVSVNAMTKKKYLPKGLVQYQEVKKRRDPTTRYDAGKQFLTNLIYMLPLNQVLARIIPFYWNPGKTT